MPATTQHRTVTVDWLLQLRIKQNRAAVTRRQQNIKCRLEKQKKKWRIVADGAARNLRSPGRRSQDGDEEAHSAGEHSGHRQRPGGIQLLPAHSSLRHGRGLRGKLGTFLSAARPLPAGRFGSADRLRVLSGVAGEESAGGGRAGRRGPTVGIDAIRVAASIFFPAGDGQRAADLLSPVLDRQRVHRGSQRCRPASDSRASLRNVSRSRIAPSTPPKTDVRVLLFCRPLERYACRGPLQPNAFCGSMPASPCAPLSSGSRC